MTQRLDTWMFGGFSASARDLAIYRVIFSGYLLVAMLPIAPWLNGVPKAFFSPPLGVAVLFNDFPSAGVFTMLNLLLGGFATLLLIGWRTRMASLGCAATMVFIKTFEYSLGKINHDILLILVPLTLAFSNWGEAYSAHGRSNGLSAESRPAIGQWCLSYLALLIALSMATAGWAKLASGWLDFSTPCSYGQLVSNHFSLNREAPLTGWAVDLGPSSWLWEIGDWLTVLLELAFLPALFVPRAWPWLLASAVLFHVGVWLLFDIVFGTNVLAYGTFVRYPKLYTRPSEMFAVFKRRHCQPTWLIGLAIVCIGLSATAVMRGQSLTSWLKLPMGEVVLISGCFIIALSFRRNVQSWVSKSFK